MRNTLIWLAQHARSVASAVCGGALLLAGSLLAAEMQTIMLSEEAPAAAGLEWKDSTTIPPGVKMIMIFGNPKQPGPYIFRAKFPSAYELPAHKHEDRRSVTVLQGHYWSGAGDRFEIERGSRDSAPEASTSQSRASRTSPGPRTR